MDKAKEIPHIEVQDIDHLGIIAGIILSPPRNALGVSTVAKGLIMESNNRLITWHPSFCLAKVMEELLGIFQYCPNFVHCRFNPFTKFCTTVVIESEDHKLIGTVTIKKFVSDQNFSSAIQTPI